MNEEEKTKLKAILYELEQEISRVKMMTGFSYDDLISNQIIEMIHNL